MAGARPRFSLLLLLVALFLGACREQGDINIRSLDFQGVKQVDKKALAAALQTKRGSKLPWWHKTYFDRRAFEADLERLQAFYRDRGFPDARVSSFETSRSSFGTRRSRTNRRTVSSSCSKVSGSSAMAKPPVYSSGCS